MNESDKISNLEFQKIIIKTTYDMISELARRK